MKKIKLYLNENEIGTLLAGLAVYETWLHIHGSYEDKEIQMLLSDMDKIRNTLRYMVFQSIVNEE